MQKKENPKIEVSAVYHKNDSIKFTISDNGEGIIPEVKERIFVPFFTTKPNGSGIGLSLCKQIITLHDGLINVESKVGYGTVFTIIMGNHDFFRQSHQTESHSVRSIQVSRHKCTSRFHPLLHQ